MTEYVGHPSLMIYKRVGWNFPLRQGVPLAHQTARESPVFTLAHTRMPAKDPRKNTNYEKPKPCMCGCIYTYMHLIPPPPPPPPAVFQRFPSHTVCLSWYIQSMNTRSQQVWTQLLNIQPNLPSRSLAFSHIISSSSALKLSFLCPPLSLQWHSISSSILSYSGSLSLYSATNPAAAAAASALCAPLSLRGSPLIALHITLNHHNNKSTRSPTNHLEGPVLKILR